MAKQRYADGVITGVQIPFFDLVRFFIKAWFAWLIASLVIFILVIGPIWFLIAAHESGARDEQIRQSLGTRNGTDTGH